MMLHKTVVLCLLFPLMLGGSRLLAADERASTRLSPTMRELPRDGEQLRIARTELNNFLLQHRLLEIERYEQAPHIVASASGSLVIGTGDEVYVHGLPSNPASLWGIYRLGLQYLDPVSNEVLGQEVLRLGTARLQARESGDTWRFSISDSQRELQPGDRLLLRDASPMSLYFEPQPAPAVMHGQVVSLHAGQRFAAQYETVLLNLGSRDAVQEGHLFDVLVATAAQIDPITGAAVALPPREGATLMVYRVFERASYAIILSSTHTTTVGDRVVSASSVR